MKTVLIVDDITMNRKIVRTILLKSLEEVDIVEADNGITALEYIYHNDVSVVILDIMMPEKDGIEVLAELKQSPIYKKIPVIMCSAIHEKESLEKALFLGALDYFTKPLKEEEIRITLPLKVKNALEIFEREKQITQWYDHIQSEMLLAEQLQKSMFAGNCNYESAVTWGRYIPCETIGGDLLCSKEVNGDVWFLIADVTGHGITSAMLSAMLNSVFHLKVSTIDSPAALLNEINDYLCSIFSDTTLGIASAFAGCIHGNKLSYANAGHPYPFFYSNKNSRIEAMTAKGFLLGFLEKSDYQLHERMIEKDDAVLCYTDGLFDKGKSKEFSSWGMVQAFCLANSNLFINKVPQLIDDMISHFRLKGDGPFIDDVAVFVVKKL